MKVHESKKSPFRKEFNTFWNRRDEPTQQLLYTFLINVCPNNHDILLQFGNYQSHCICTSFLKFIKRHAIKVHRNFDKFTGVLTKFCLTIFCNFPQIGTFEKRNKSKQQILPRSIASFDCSKCARDGVFNCLGNLSEV